MIPDQGRTPLHRRSDRHREAPAPGRLTRTLARLDAFVSRSRALLERSRQVVHWPGFVIAVVLAAFFLVRPLLKTQLADAPAVATWLTVLVAICLQALPFLVGGVLISAVVSTWVSPVLLARILPRRAVVAVPAAAVAGLALPGCECAAVPIAGAFVRRGMPPAVALTFLLAAPAINPVVIVSTAVAFPGRPAIVVARVAASFATAVVVGWLWLRLGRGVPLRSGGGSDSGAAVDRFVARARHDLLHAGGFLVVGGAVAATVNVLVPTDWLDALGGNLVVAVLALAVLAFVVAICSEADAFVAASMSRFPVVAQLAFMVVGPAVDVKLVSMQAGVFGRRFATRFAPLTFVVAVLSAVAAGTVLL